MLMVKKTVKFTKDAIEKLPKDKPVVYKIGEPTNPEYIGETEKNAKRRIAKHMPPHNKQEK